MKNLIVTFLVIAPLIYCYSQKEIDPCKLCVTELVIEIDSIYDYWELDTTLLNNIWTYGIPNKDLFNEGIDNSSVIITDTINPYPINNTSTFEITWRCDYDFNCPGFGTFDGFSFNLQHKIDTELGKDGGKIELSIDGAPFKNVVNFQDTIQFYGDGEYTSSDFVESLNDPGFSGLIEEWSFVQISSDYDFFGDGIPVKIRFTFASDSIETSQEGWMIGEISTYWSYLNVETINQGESIIISPNPANSEIIITLETSDVKQYRLLDNHGKVIKRGNTSGLETRLEIGYLPSGFYVLMIEDQEKYYFTKKLMKF